MGYTKNVVQVEKDIEKKISDNIFKSANMTILENAKENADKINLARVVNSANPCSFCTSHAKEFRVGDKECSKASEFHSGCRCQLIVKTKTVKRKKGGIEYRKERNKMTDGEKKTADVFESFGYHVVTLKEVGSNPKNIDFLIDRKLVEHKNVTSLSSLKSQLNRSRKKFYVLKVRKHRHAITDIGSEVGEKEIIEFCQGWKKDIDIIYFIHNDKIIII